MDPPAFSLSTAPPPSILVGVGVLVITEEGRIYFRQGRDGSLALPAGHLRLYEEWSDAAKRIVLEEMNVDLSSVTSSEIQMLHVTNDPMPNTHHRNKTHYVSLFMACRLRNSQVPHETESAAAWKTYSWEQLQELYENQKLFGPLANLVKENPSTLHVFLHPNHAATTATIATATGARSSFTSEWSKRTFQILFGGTLGLFIILLAILVALLLTTDFSCDETAESPSNIDANDRAVASLTPTSAPSSNTDWTTIAPTALSVDAGQPSQKKSASPSSLQTTTTTTLAPTPRLPPPNVNMLRHICSPELIAISSSCVQTCSQATCCNYPTWMEDDSCLAEYAIECWTYHAYCYRLDPDVILEQTSLPEIVVETNATNITSAQACANLNTSAGIQACHDACAPARCCFDSSDGSCAQNNAEECRRYAPCLGLVALEYVEEPTIPALVNASCVDAANETNGGMARCQEACAQAVCCFEQDNCPVLTDRNDFCGQYEACSAVYGGKQVIVDPPTVDDLCAVDKIATAEGRSACEDVCSKAICCFVPFGGACDFDCSKYKACLNEIPSGTRSLRNGAN